MSREQESRLNQLKAKYHLYKLVSGEDKRAVKYFFKKEKSQNKFKED